MPTHRLVHRPSQRDSKMQEHPTSSGRVTLPSLNSLWGSAASRIPLFERLGAIVLDDVNVPVGEAAWLLNGIHEMPPAEGVTVATFGHAGDGNYHPTFVYQRGDTSARARAVDQAAAISAQPSN